MTVFCVNCAGGLDAQVPNKAESEALHLKGSFGKLVVHAAE
jgi:hypothetical protein